MIYEIIHMYVCEAGGGGSSVRCWVGCATGALKPIPEFQSRGTM